METLLLMIIGQIARGLYAYLKEYFAQKANNTNWETYTKDTIHLIESAFLDLPWFDKLAAVVDGYVIDGVQYKGAMDYADEIGLKIDRRTAVTSTSAYHAAVMEEIKGGKRSLEHPSLTALTDRIILPGGDGKREPHLLK